MEANPPRRMDPHDKLKLRSAAYRVRSQKLGLPPAVAELLAREIMVWEELGYWLGTSSLVRRAVEEIMKWPSSGDEDGTRVGEERKMETRVGSGAVGYE